VVVRKCLSLHTPQKVQPFTNIYLLCPFQLISDALSAKQLQQASQAEPITSPVEDRPYRPNGNGNSAKSKKPAMNKTKDNSSSGDSDGLPRGIKVVPLTPLDMVQPTTANPINTNEKLPSFSTQYLQEQRYITQPSQRDLLYSTASGNLSGNSVSDFTISQGEEEALENVNTSNVTLNSTATSRANSNVNNSAVKYSTALAVHTAMGPPSTIRSPLPHTNTTHTSSSATQNTPNQRYTSSSGTSSSGMKTSSHPAETQSYQSPSQLSQSEPIVMINNNTSQGNDMVRRGAPVVMTRYKLREKEGTFAIDISVLLCAVCLPCALFLHTFCLITITFLTLNCIFFCRFCYSQKSKSWSKLWFSWASRSTRSSTESFIWAL